MNKTSLYDLKQKEYYTGANIDLFGLVEVADKSILDVGCSEGNSATYLRSKGAEEIWGVEMSLSAASQAQQKMDYVFIGTIEAFLESEHVANRFDLIILGDVLEHLFDPWLVLKRLSGLLTESGQILISLPNVRNISVLKCFL